MFNSTLSSATRYTSCCKSSGAKKVAIPTSLTTSLPEMSAQPVPGLSMAFGYLCNDETKAWLYDLGLEHGIEDRKDWIQVVNIEASYILRRSLGPRHKYCAVTHMGKSYNCFTIATTNPRDNLPLPTDPMVWAKLSEMLQRKNPPLWFKRS